MVVSQLKLIAKMKKRFGNLSKIIWRKLKEKDYVMDFKDDGKRF